MRQRAHPAEGRLVVGEDARLILLYPHAVRAVLLARAWFGVNPALIKSARRERAEARGKCPELLDNELVRLLITPCPVALRHRSEEIVPGKLWETQRVRLGVQIAPKHREIVARGAEHRIKSRAVDVRVKKRGVKW